LEIEKMYGYVSGGDNAAAGKLFLDEYEDFEQLKSQYPEHEVYLFAGDKIDMALFIAPGVSAMLIESRASPDQLL
jgi:hypothetical protein